MDNEPKPAEEPDKVPAKSTEAGSAGDKTGDKKKTAKLSWSKILMVIMILLCAEIIMYTEIIMWITWDTSSLYALVGVAASLAASIWAYCEKAKAENTAGGITYDAAIKNKEPEPDNEDGSFG